MLNKKYTICILENKGGFVKQKEVSKLLLVGLSSFFCVCFFSFLIVAYNFFQTNSLTNLNKLNRQKEEIAMQKKYIQLFADNLNKLNNKLRKLNDFDKKIRIAANISSNIEENDVFVGIGGFSSLDDIEIDANINKNHSALIRKSYENNKQLEELISLQENSFKELLKEIKNKKSILSKTPAIKPTRGWLTSNFGYRVSPFTGKKDFHKGLDIANKIGTPVKATGDGIITFVGTKTNYGKLIKVDHGRGFVTVYAHLNKIQVKKGDFVKRNEQIATMGNTGRTTGPHLHYEVIKNGLNINPQKYILN